MNPIWHSESSMRKWGGTIDNYLPLHEKMDCSKGWVADSRHRVLTHTMFWIKEVMIPIFGSYIVLEDGKKVSVKDICELHILEDYKMKYIPTPQDFIQEMDFKPWMQNGNGVPSSAQKLYKDLTAEIEAIKSEIVPEKPPKVENNFPKFHTPRLRRDEYSSRIID